MGSNDIPNPHGYHARPLEPRKEDNYVLIVLRETVSAEISCFHDYGLLVFNKLTLLS